MKKPTPRVAVAPIRSGRTATSTASKERKLSCDTATPVEGAEFARLAGLRYVGDHQPGIIRHRRGSNFSYRDAGGKPVRDPATLARIRSLAIPPAWTGVWICPNPQGHLQATGRDARGRKQYRYHPKWREVRDGNKYSRMLLFARCLPALRKKVQGHLRHKQLDRDKVLAAVVSLLEKSLIRVGNDEYATANGSYGLTTLQDRHARIGKGKIQFRFTGKSGVRHEVEVEDPQLAKVVRQCQELPGQELFQYDAGEGRIVDITSGDVNEYLRRLTGYDFTAKDFRTWAGTVLAALALQEFEEFDSEAQAKKNVLRAIERFAGRLGNTPAVCRKCYIHPVVLQSYMDRSMLHTAGESARREMRQSLAKLPPEEAAVLALLERRLTEQAA